MNHNNRTGGEPQETRQSGWSAKAPAFDSQYAELIELVWHCERVWKLEDRMEAVIRYDRNK